MRCTIQAITLTVIGLPHFAGANIIDVNADDDGDGAVECTANWMPETSTLMLTCSQSWAPGHVTGAVTTDTELDPTLWIVSTIQNGTGVAWGGYHLGITMNKSFSIVGIVAPSDWTWEIQPPTQIGSSWVGGINLTGGTPVSPDEIANMGYVLSFDGSMNFAQEMVPMEIPEPSSLAVLLLCGGALCGRRIRRRI